MRALGAPRARKLHPRARADTLAPLDLGPLCSTSPRTTLLTATRQAALAAYSAAVRALVARRRPQRAPASVGADKPPAHATSLLEQCELIRKRVC